MIIDGKDWKDRLREDFSFMDPEKIEKETTYRKWGFECSGGWYELLRDCCEKIRERYEKEGLPVDFVPVQIKEKFGVLRFYYEYRDAPLTVFAIDSLEGSGVRFAPGTEDSDEDTRRLREDIARFIHEAEEKSAHVCEFCGAEGERRKDLRWIKTLCGEHY
ncbi:MAG: hypothetical protein IJ873_00750, partial [Lachnospiraceae bacterium]|nr:hypothetical protein [Lachnospiraceae bacterium]